MTVKRNKNIKNINNAKIVKPDFEPIEDIFDKAKKVMLMKLETNVEVSKRIDNLMSVRDSAYRYWGDALDEKYMPSEKMQYFKKVQQLTTNTYELMYKIAEGFELEEFLKEDMKDYFEDIIVSCDDVNDERDLFEGMVVFQCVQPYGSQMNQIHQMLVEEQEKRAVYEKENA